MSSLTLMKLFNDFCKVEANCAAAARNDEKSLPSSLTFAGALIQHVNKCYSEWPRQPDYSFT